MQSSLHENVFAINKHMYIGTQKTKKIQNPKKQVICKLIIC